MIRFKTKILRFGEMGDKTGWSYIVVPGKLAGQLNPANRKSFRVKGKLDDHPIGGMALLPRSDGDYILALKAAIRKALRKQKGDTLDVQLEVDTKVITPPKDLLDCLADEPRALDHFKSLPKSHQNWYGNWVKAAKTDGTKARRIAQIVDAMVKKMPFGEMLRAYGETARAMREDR